MKELGITASNYMYFPYRKNGSVYMLWKTGGKVCERVCTPEKIISHKLWSTFGTTLYRETEGIYLVADVMGHSDVGTTKKHYAVFYDTTMK